MFNFFNRSKAPVKPSINSVVIPNSGWMVDYDTKTLKQWTNNEDTIRLTQNFFELEPDLPTIKNEDVLRNLFRENISGMGGGLITAEIISLRGQPAFKMILKVPQEPSGVTYVGSYIIPFKNYSYVIKLQAIEAGVTGMRDTMVAQKLIVAGAETDENGFIKGWFADPYLKDFAEGRLMNKSEQEEYDVQFPKHPLSQVRRLMAEIEAGIAFRPEIGALETFDK